MGERRLATRSRNRWMRLSATAPFTLADQIQRAADWAKSETDLQFEVAGALKQFARRAKLNPLEEHHNVTIATGRRDSVYGSVIVEYKVPGTLSPNKDAAPNKAVVEQLKRYFYDSKWSDKIFETRSELPFHSSEIESFGRGSLQRQDFRVYERKPGGRGKLALCGEVKLPGTQQGRSPFDPSLVQDAFTKATRENCHYFFTWNVEHLALFDRKLWDVESLHEKCIGEWRLHLELNRPEDVTRPAVRAKLQDEFLPRFYAEFADIWLGRKRDYGLPPSEFYVNVLESHLAGPLGPVRELRDHLSVKADEDKAFDTRLRTLDGEGAAVDFRPQRQQVLVGSH